MAKSGLRMSAKTMDLRPSRTSSSNAYFLMATIACTVIVSIGLVVFCCLQTISGGKSGVRTTSNGLKYEKAPLHPVDDVDESDEEEVETFNKRRFSDILTRA